MVKLMPPDAKISSTEQISTERCTPPSLPVVLADSVTYNACSAVAFAALTMENCDACCAQLVLYKSLHLLL